MPTDTAATGRRTAKRPPLRVTARVDQPPADLAAPPSGSTKATPCPAQPAMTTQISPLSADAGRSRPCGRPTSALARDLQPGQPTPPTRRRGRQPPRPTDRQRRRRARGRSAGRGSRRSLRDARRPDAARCARTPPALTTAASTTRRLPQRHSPGCLREMPARAPRSTPDTAMSRAGTPSARFSRRQLAWSPAGTIFARRRAAGASPPWYLSEWRRGRGI